MSDNQQNNFSKKLDAVQVIDEILAYTGLKPAQFLRKIGANLTTITDIRNGKTKTISRKLAEKVMAEYPEISENFLVLGMPPLLKADIVAGDNSQTITGSNIHHNSNTTVDDRLLKMLEDSQKMLQDSQQERLRLLGIIENLTSSDK